MAIVNGYCSVDLLRPRLRFRSTGQDDDLERVIEAASRAIDAWTGHRYFAVSETRYYTPTNPFCLTIHEALAVTSVVTDQDGNRTYETTWDAAQDYSLTPRNAALDGKPYTGLLVSPRGRYRFPCLTNAVSVAGSFGYSANTPRLVEEACLRLAARLWALGSTVQLIATPDAGKVEISADPELRKLLSPMMNRWVLV